MSNDINDFIDDLREISDEMIDTEWRNELGINSGERPIVQEDDLVPLDFDLPDFEMDEDELLINKGEY